MALNTLKCNHLALLGLKGLTVYFTDAIDQFNQSLFVSDKCL